MRYTTYGKFVPGLADTVNLQALLEHLGDFFLQTGFAGGNDPWWGDVPPELPDRSPDALREAILKALMESGNLTPAMVEFLRNGTAGDPETDARLRAELGAVLDEIVERLVAEGYIAQHATPEPLTPSAPADPAPGWGPGSEAATAARQVQFEATDKGIDFLAYKTLRQLLGALGRSTLGAHDTLALATGVEVEAASRPYQYGDVLNLDVPSTLRRAIAREGIGVPLRLDYDDLMVHESVYRSAAATVLLLDCSHSMILYGEDRFTPAKKVALALTHLIRTQFPGDTLRVVLFHDGAEEIPLGAIPKAAVGPYHTNTAAGLKLARRLLLAQRHAMRQIILITDGKPSAITLEDGRVYLNASGLDPRIVKATLHEASLCRRSRIQINTFMLARNPGLVQFVMQLSALCRGKAYFTNTMTLGQFILMDFLRRRTTRH